MTRLSKYQLYCCPSAESPTSTPCGLTYQFYVPPSINPHLPRLFQSSGFQAPLDGWIEAGTIERYTPEELERRGAIAMHLFGAGPPKPPLLQRIREALFGRPEPVDPSAKFPEIAIACDENEEESSQSRPH